MTKSELKSFSLTLEERKTLNKAMDICKKLRRDYDWYYGDIRDNIMCGSYKAIEGIDMVLKNQR